MQWSDDGIVLSARKHGESSAIVQVLTRAQGRHAGLVRGGAGRSKRGILQPGNEIRATWRARLVDHLGNYTVEPVRARAAQVMDDPLRLGALSSACAVAEVALPEREAHPAAYDGFILLLDAIEKAEHWPHIYVRWELGLLGELGFGLDLSACAQTGEVGGLAYISPRTGRAVTAAAAGQYKHRLLKLPAFLSPLGNGDEESEDDVADGLALTGFFLERHVLAPHHMPVPPARTRFVARFNARFMAESPQ